MAKDYSAIAAKKIRKPGERPPRLLIYGRNKQGKTTFSATAPGKVLFLDPEGGAEFVTNDNVDLWPVERWEDVSEALAYLKAGDHDYSWVVVDGLTRVANMSLKFVMAQQEERDLDRIPGFVQMKDYGKSGELMKGMLFAFHALPIGVIYTAQDRMESLSFDDSEDEDSETAEMRFVPDLPKGVRSSVNAIVDVIGRIYTVRVEGMRNGQPISGTQRRLWVSPSERYDTGYRSKSKLPSYVKAPTVPKLVALIRGEEKEK